MPRLSFISGARPIFASFLFDHALDSLDIPFSFDT